MTDEAGFALLTPGLQHHIVNTLQWDGLRPLQEAAVGPLVRGEDALLLAPTAGGKTEAVLFPLLTRAESERWRGTSILYVCPLRALLNNLEPRVSTYAAWLGRTAAVRHGDTTTAVRRRLALEHPDILLTTPESLEAMLVSQTLDSRVLLGDVRAVVIDEIHAFAADDRGWHLLAVLERVAALGARPLQRVGLSATVSNPDELARWLQGPPTPAPVRVINPPAGPTTPPDLQLDYVGSLSNAAKVIAALHQGQKRLVFVETRAGVEDLAQRLRELEVVTFVSHSSLAADERRQAEQAFAESTNCVIVSTSTLELGIDVGDLDQVVQVGAPQSVASFLQRLGRAGRRAGTRRAMTFLAVTENEIVQAAAVLLLWSEGFVEPVEPPPEPRHVLAQQLLAMALQHHQLGRSTWDTDLHGLPLGNTADRDALVTWALEKGHLDSDGGMMFVGPQAERRYGHRHFLELLAVFTAPPQFGVVHGRREIGSVDPFVLVRKVQGPRVIALGGRAWAVTAVDWPRRRAFVEPADRHGAARWTSVAQPQRYELVEAQRRVLLGAQPDSVELTDRALAALGRARDEEAGHVDAGCTLVRTEGSRTRWWTWAGGRANAMLTAALETVDPTLVDGDYVYDNRQVGLRSGVTATELRRAAHQVQALLAGDLGRVRPFVTERALEQLKFADLLPPGLARRTLEERLIDPKGVRAVLDRPVAAAV